MNVSNRNERIIVICNNTGALKTHKCNEQTNPCTNRQLQLTRNGIDDFSRKPVKERATKINPETNTPESAACHEIPIPRTTEKAKNAFSPMPGAIAIGYLAINPIRKQPAAEANAVAVKTAPDQFVIYLENPVLLLKQV